MCGIDLINSAKLTRNTQKTTLKMQTVSQKLIPIASGNNSSQGSKTLIILL